MAKRVLLAVSGGIAAYKACDIVSALKKRDVEVQVMMTENATKFVTPLTFEALSGRMVYADTFDYSFDASIKHISLAQEADLLCVAPATANIIAKMACGIADDMVSSTFLAATCPTVVCPAMNTHMYENAATQANVRTLEQRGIGIVGPGVGKLACGDVARGTLSPVEEIVDAVMCRLQSEA
ncbi:MAG: flavoprotein [Slackia sp.]|nr:flavoprotein [Slackia sp.]